MATASTAASPAQAGASKLDRAIDVWSRFWFAPSDPVNLSAMRLALGAISLYWAASYTPDLIRFFGPDGLVPLGTLYQMRGSTFPRSFFEFATSPAALWSLHVVCLVVLALFTAGLWTRATSVLAWIVVGSYVHRAPFLMTPVEPVLLMLLVYLSIGPAGEHFSLDAMRRRKALAAKPHLLEQAEAGARQSWSATLALRLVQVHLTLVYAAMALAKVNDRQSIAADPGSYHAWWQGEAAWWLAARPHSPLLDVSPLLNSSVLLVNAWTFAILLFEGLFAILIWRPSMRPLMLALAVPMWLSLAVILGQPLFCLAMLAGNLAFVAPGRIKNWALGARR